jgi:hypothetical protein
VREFNYWTAILFGSVVLRIITLLFAQRTADL